MTLTDLLNQPLPLSDEHQAELHRLLAENMAEIGRLLIKLKGQIRQKPLIGGVFGYGRFVLASHSYVSGKLDKVDYMVLEARPWLVLGIGHSRSEALAQARQALTHLSPMYLAQFIEQLVIKRKDEADRVEAQQREQRDLWVAEQKAKYKVTAKSIPKRRREIFDASNGQCHYCSTPLTLDGRWHIEHKMPKALMGGNEPSNLVASCAPCNHKKRDRTDQEFIASRNAA